MQLEHHQSIALMRMNAGRANAMNPAFVGALRKLVQEFETSEAQALVLTGYERFFCAGLDLVELQAMDRASMGAFMHDFHDLMTRIFGQARPVVAAVNGHAIAGGCVLAMQADLRVGAASARLGLRETQLGVGLPVCVIESLRAALPPTSFLPVALEGGLFDAETSQGLGLLQEVVEPDKLETRALERATELASIPPLAYAQVKAALRRPALQAMAAERERDGEAWLETWFSDAARTRVQAAVEAMGSQRS